MPQIYLSLGVASDYWGSLFTSAWEVGGGIPSPGPHFSGTSEPLSICPPCWPRRLRPRAPIESCVAQPDVPHGTQSMYAKRLIMSSANNADLGDGLRGCIFLGSQADACFSIVTWSHVAHPVHLCRVSMNQSTYHQDRLQWTDEKSQPNRTEETGDPSGQFRKEFSSIGSRVSGGGGRSVQ